MASRPTCLLELVSLTPTLDGYHDSSGRMFGVVVLPGPSDVPRVLQKQPSDALLSKNKLAAQPIVWCVPYPRMWLTAWSPTKTLGRTSTTPTWSSWGVFFNIFVWRIAMICKSKQSSSAPTTLPAYGG